MINELWGTPDGRMYHQLDNWGGFWKVEPLVGGRDLVKELPGNAVLLMWEGKWLPGVLDAGAAEHVTHDDISRQRTQAALDELVEVFRGKSIDY